MAIRFYKDEKHKGAQHMTLSYTKRYTQRLESEGIRSARGLLISADSECRLTECRHLTHYEKPAYLTLGKPVTEKELGKPFAKLAKNLSPLYVKACVNEDWMPVKLELDRYITRMNGKGKKETQE